MVVLVCFLCFCIGFLLEQSKLFDQLHDWLTLKDYDRAREKATDDVIRKIERNKWRD